MATIVGSGSITLLDSYDMPTLQVVMDNSNTLQQTYDVNRTPAYLPDRGSTPLIVAMKITQPTLGGSIQLAANQLSNIKWGTELGASDLQPYANGLIFTLMDNGFVPAGTSKSVYFQAEYTNPLNKVVQTVNFNFELITLVTGAQGQQGNEGATGAVGATLSMLTNREPVFSFSDGVPTVFSDIVFTVSTQNLNSPTYIWYVGAEPTTNTTNTYSVSAEAFGTKAAMQLVCYVTSAEGVTYSVTGSVNRVNSYTAEAGATNGATVGVNLLDSAAGVLYGTDILNKYSNAAQLAGDLSGNPFLVRVDAEYDRPANVKAVWGTSVKAGLGFTDENRNCLKMYGSIARSAGWPAIKVQAGMKYAANLRWRVLNAASQAAGVFFVFLYTTGDLAPGCTHIGISGATDETGVDPSGIWNGPAESTVSDTLTPAWSGVYHNRPSSPSWQMTTVEFKPPADAKWCSFVALGWDQLGPAAEMQIDTCYIYSEINSVTSSQVAAGAITELQLAADAVTAAKLSVAALDGETGALNVDTVGTAQLVANAVEAVNLANGAVTAAKTSLSAINNVTGQLNSYTVDTAQLVSEAVEAANLATGAVTASKTALAAINSVTGTLNTGTVSSTQLVADAVQAVNIANNAVTASKTAIAAISSSTGLLNVDTVGTAQLVANAVEAVKIANGAVTAAKTSLAAIDNFTGLLNPGTVNTTQLVAEAVQAVNLANGAVTASKVSLAAINSATGGLNGGTVTNAQLVAEAVQSVNIANNAVTASKVSLAAIDSLSGGLTANSVGASQIAAGAVQSDKLAAMSVTASKLNVSLGGGNLLRNSSFDFGNADHWGGVDFSTTLSNFRMMYKGFSLRCQATSSGDRYLWQHAACKPNTRYTLSAWIWVEALDPSALFGRSVLLYDQIGTSNSDNSLVYGIEGSRWHRVSTSITTGPNAATIESRLYIPFGVVYWDCAQLEEGDYPTAYAPMPQELIPSSIDTGLLANLAVTDVKIAAGAVNSSKLSIRKHLIY